MATEYRYGPMVLSTKEIGGIIKPVVLANSFMSTAIYLMGSGNKIKQMAMGLTCIQMEPNMKVSGRMICSMGRVQNYGQTAASTLVTFLKGKSMGKANMNGLMGAFMKENGRIIK